MLYICIYVVLVSVALYHDLISSFIFLIVLEISK